MCKNTMPGLSMYKITSSYMQPLGNCAETSLWHRRRKVKNIGGAKGGGANPQQAHDVVMTSMRRNDVASTSFRRHVPTRFLINQCQIITFLIKI